MSKFWQDCLDHLRVNEQIEPNEYSTWLRPIQGELDGDTLFLFVQNRFMVNWVQERYLGFITDVARLLSNNAQLNVVVREGIKPSGRNQSAENTPARADKNSYKNHLDGQLLFENFVQGKSNQMAKAIAMQVASEPGSKDHNPLALYGGVGLGKTHLLHAIGNQIMKNNPKARVMYIHVQRFGQDMVSALQKGAIEQFKAFYRSLDVLLVDDIRFFTAKNKTQEEFFHIFNSLFEQGKQIIVTSNCLPKEIEQIDEGLKSRLNWGLAVQIEPPDLDTRIAILKQKAREKGLALPDDVAFFIGQKMRTHVRELEMAINNLKSYVNFMHAPVSIDTVREALRDQIASHDRNITIDNIQKVVAGYYKIRVEDLKGKNRSRSFVRPRQLAMALTKELTQHSLPEIGREFGGRDHTTVLHACRTIAALRETDPPLKDDFNNILQTLTF